MFLICLSLVGPTVAILGVSAFIQFRIFGPITGQPLFRNWTWLYFNSDNWESFMRWASLCGGVVFLVGSENLQSCLHVFYCRCLRLAFFSDGKDRSWERVKALKNTPYLLLTATVNDFKLPTEKPGGRGLGEIFFSPLYTGGDK